MRLKVAQQANKENVAKEQARRRSIPVAYMSQSHNKVATLLALQRTHGNRYVQRLLNGTALQRKCACGSMTAAGGECEECSKKKPTLQNASFARTHRRRSEDKGQVPSIFPEILRSSGNPLDPITHPFMQPRFSHDFSQVRVSTAGEAEQTSPETNGSSKQHSAVAANVVSGLVGTSTPVMVGTSAAMLPAAVAAVRISTKDIIPRNFEPCGGFHWGIAWRTNANSGFIVQKIHQNFNVMDCVIGHLDTSRFRFTPRYWEAWEVDASGQANPKAQLGANDWWESASFNETRGEWLKEGSVHWVPALDPAAGFGSGGIHVKRDTS